MATATPIFGSLVTMTCTLASLASDANLLIGRETTARDQKDVDDCIDALLGGTITTGTSPTAAKQIEVWLYGSYDDTNFSASATGADAGLTVTAESKSLMRLLTIIPTHATSNTGYKWGPFSVAQAFGGIIPVQWGAFIVHNTGVALHATGGNHEIEYFPVKFESA